MRMPVAATMSLLLALVCYGCSWEVRGTNGEPCHVERGWSQPDVARACGLPSATGWQPEVWRGLFDHTACSAPGDIYDKQVVLYDCDGKVWSVKVLPATGFIGPPSVRALIELLQYDYQREMAIKELQKMGPAAKEALPALRALRNNADERIRAAAQAAIDAIDQPS